MAETTKISVRLADKTIEQLDTFGKLYDMNRTAVIELFVKFGMSAIEKSDAKDERMDKLEAQLKAMQKTNYKALAYLSMSVSHDPERLDKATAIAEKNNVEIFG